MPNVLLNAFIGTPGGRQEFFFDNVDQTKARLLTAVPEFQVTFDQQAELVEVYYILKGSDHGREGGAETLQLHTIVENKQGGVFNVNPPFLFYKILVSES